MVDIQTTDMAPWPRRLVNFPIILIAIVCQYVWAVTIVFDYDALNTTGAHILHVLWGSVLLPHLVPWMVAAALALSATMAVLAFFVPYRWQTMFMLIPQQGFLYLSAGASLWSIINAKFADGVVRSHGFLLVDQSMLILSAVFHTWAMILILLYSTERH